MASEKQILANRRNAQRSTGPRTPEGKAAVSQNALKHGLRARGILFPATGEEFQSVHDSLAADLRPQNPAESCLVEQMAVALYRRVRFDALEVQWLARAFQGEFPSALDFISRRQSSLSRDYHRALWRLLKPRLARRGRLQPAPPNPCTGDKK
jgi:hypothetical protein